MAQPLTRFTNGKIQLSVWENDGAKGKYHSIKIGKRYKDPKTGEWRDSGGFFAGELSQLQGLLQQAIDFLADGGAASLGGRSDGREEAGSDRHLSGV